MNGEVNVLSQLGDRKCRERRGRRQRRQQELEEADGRVGKAQFAACWSSADRLGEWKQQGPSRSWASVTAGAQRLTTLQLQASA